MLIRFAHSRDNLVPDGIHGALLEPATRLTGQNHDNFGTVLFAQPIGEHAGDSSRRQVLIFDINRFFGRRNGVAVKLSNFTHLRPILEGRQSPGDAD